MDYYLKTTSKDDFIEDLKKIGIEILLVDNYYQDQNILIDWIGLIHNPIEFDQNDEIIGEITYKEGEHVNIRSMEVLDIQLFENTKVVYPEIPYRIFS
jgi:hypothetical protein